MLGAIPSLIDYPPILHSVILRKLSFIHVVSIIIVINFYSYSSVVTVLNKAGEPVNSYDYDPFGRVVAASEGVRNIFQYVGQLGVIKDEAVENVYMMRARHYDATQGRFISFDPLGT